MHSPPSRLSGFTLVELMVSTAVTSGILASAYLCLQAGFEGEKALETRMDALQNARVALALLSADLRAATVLDDKLEFIGMDRELDGKQADNLDFATRNWRPEAPGEGDLCEVSYYVDVSPETGEKGLWRRVDSSPDAQPLDGGSRERIPGLVALQLEYYDGFEWYDDWGKTSGRPEEVTSALRLNAYGLPDAVRITLSTTASSRSSKRRSIADADAVDAVRLQTVVRLNLAGRAWAARSSAASPSPGGAKTSGAEPK